MIRMRADTKRPFMLSLRLPVEKDRDVAESIAENDNEKELTDRELKDKCFQYAQQNFQGEKFHNAHTGRDILVSREGLDKWFNITKSREQSISIKKLNVILEKCKMEGSDVDRKQRHGVDGFSYFIFKMKINRKPFTVRLATKETHGTDSKYYYHYLEDIKIEPGSTLA